MKLIGIAGHSGSGKATLIEKPIPLRDGPLLWPDDAHVVAVAPDAQPVAELPARIARVDPDDVPAVARLIVDAAGFGQNAGDEGESDAVC